MPNRKSPAPPDGLPTYRILTGPDDAHQVRAYKTLAPHLSVQAKRKTHA